MEQDLVDNMSPVNEELEEELHGQDPQT